VELIKKIWVLLVFVFLMAPLFLHFSGLKLAFMLSENRQLATWPALPGKLEDLSEWTTSIDNYLEDNNPLRSAFIMSSNTMQTTVGVSPNKFVVIGKEDWLFANYRDAFKVHIGRENLSKTQLDIVANSIEKHQRYFEAKGLKFYFLVAPDKHGIYPEFFPDLYQNVPIHRKENVNVIDHFKTQSTLHVVDPRDRMMAAKEDHLLYYRGDTHWNSIGAYQAYWELMKTLAIDFHNIRILKWRETDVQAVTKRGGDLARVINHQKTESNFDLTPKVDAIVSDVIIQKAGPDLRMDNRIITTSNTSAPVLLLLRDSFAERMIPFLAHSFSKIILISHGKGLYDKSIIKRHQVDVVVFQAVERILTVPLQED